MTKTGNSDALFREKCLTKNNYKYRLEISGDPRGSSAMIMTYIVLSNTQEITFNQALMASGLSSNLNDYFAPEESVIVGVIW